MSIEFPPEIVDHIVGYVKSDTHTLKSCSLVGISWLHSSRMHLFRRISLDSSNYKRFFNLFDMSDLPPCTSHCTRLDIARADWLFSLDGEWLRQVVLRFSTTVTTLSISDATVPSVYTLLEAIAPFHRLRHLITTDVRIGKPTSNTHHGPDITLPSITSLELRNTRLEDFVPYSFETFQNITDIHVDVVKGGELGQLRKFMGPMLSQIRRLSISFALYQDSYEFNPFCLKACSVNMASTQNAIQRQYSQRYGMATGELFKNFSTLQTISIGSYLNSGRGDRQTSLDWTPRILASITSPSLRHVILGFCVDRAGQVDQYTTIDWGFLDEIFNSECYMNLESIVIESSGRADLLSLLDLLSTRLPRSSRRGLLKCISSRDDR